MPELCCPRLPYAILTTFQLIELWETFLLQLDADEEADAGFYKSPPPPAALASEAGDDSAPKLTDVERSQPATGADVALEQDA